MAIPDHLTEFVENPPKTSTVSEAFQMLYSVVGHAGISMARSRLQTYLQAASEKTLHWRHDNSMDVSIGAMFNKYPHMLGIFDYEAFWKHKFNFAERNGFIALWQNPIDPKGIGGSVETGDYSRHTRLPRFIFTGENKDGKPDYLRISYIESVLLEEFVKARSLENHSVHKKQLFKSVYGFPYSKEYAKQYWALTTKIAELKSRINKPDAAYCMDSVDGNYFWLPK
jgi:hypothetical protein